MGLVYDFLCLAFDLISRPAESGDQLAPTKSTRTSTFAARATHRAAGAREVEGFRVYELILEGFWPTFDRLLQTFQLRVR